LQECYGLGEIKEAEEEYDQEEVLHGFAGMTEFDEPYKPSRLGLLKITGTMLDSKANRIILGSVADEYFEPDENNDFLDSAEAEEWDDIIDDAIEHSIENSDVISPQFLTGLHRLKASSIGNFFKNARVGLKSTVILARPSDASKMQRAILPTSNFIMRVLP